MGSYCACLSKADAPADVSNTKLDGSSFEPLDKGIAEIAALANTTTTLPAPAAALRVSAADNEAVREDDPLYSIEPAALVDGGGVPLLTTSHREASHSLVVHPNVTSHGSSSSRRDGGGGGTMLFRHLGNATSFLSIASNVSSAAMEYPASQTRDSVGSAVDQVIEPRRRGPDAGDTSFRSNDALFEIV